MSVALYTHAACLEHDPSEGHPESPGRLRAILHALSAPEFQSLLRRDAPLVSGDALARAHDPGHIERINKAAEAALAGYVAFGPDTIMSAGTLEAAHRAAGAVVAAVDAVMAGEVGRAFCAVRPPGHHAERDGVMGFCFFNNASVGALHACEAHGLARVAIVDFDVHHGNGGQELAECDARVFYASIHEEGAYPQSGFATDRGCADNVVNAPAQPGAGSQAWRARVEAVLLGPLEAFAPELLIISAGFDAHRADPLANLMLEDEDFEWATRAFMGAAKRAGCTRVVSTLEGGYDLDALARSAAAHVRALMSA